MTATSKPVRADKRSVMNFGPAALLTICVGTGSEQRSFIAHESFLTSRSEYFRRATNGAWEEAASRTVKLPEDDPHIFELYMSLVYTGRVPVKSGQEDADDVDQKKICKLLQEEYASLFRLYVLADKLQDPATKDAAIAAVFEVLISSIHNGPYPIPAYKTLSMVYEHLPAGSPARRLAVDIASNCNIEDMFQSGENLPSEYLKDLVVLLRRRAGQGYNSKCEATRNGVAAYMDHTAKKYQGSEASLLELWGYTRCQAKIRGGIWRETLDATADGVRECAQEEKSGDLPEDT